MTIVDVARAAGTSVSSTAVALRGEPGVRIPQTADRLGYRPDQRARMLREQRPSLLGVTFTVSQTFHADVVGCLCGAVDGSGDDLVLMTRPVPRRAAGGREPAGTSRRGVRGHRRRRGAGRAVPADGLAAAAVGCAVARAEGTAEPGREIITPPRLVVSATSRPPRSR